MGVIRKLTGGAGVLGAVREVIANTKVTGRPIFERDKPASITIAGIEFFERDEELNRTYLWGLIKRGKSGYAKKALARKAAGK